MADETKQDQKEELSLEQLEKATAPTITTETPAEPPAAPAPTPAPTPAPVVEPNLSEQIAKVQQQQAKPAAPAPAPKATVTQVKPAVVAEPSAADIVARAKAEASPIGKIVLQSVLNYMEIMAPKKPVPAPIGARYQVGLYRSLTRAINNLDDDFNLVFTAILRLFAENAGRGVFGEEHVFRFMENVALTEDEIKSFQRLLNLLINTADVKGRAAGLRMTDFNKTLEFGITDEGRSRVLTYFNK